MKSGTNIKHVAAEAGVSIFTVSKVLNGFTSGQDHEEGVSNAENLRRNNARRKVT